MKEQYVVKANALIRKTRYNLTTQQQKIVLFAISKIHKGDAPFTVYRISLEELCKACGLDYDAGGYYYHAIREDLQKLTKREWCTLPDKTEMTISWIGDAKCEPGSGFVDIRFNPNMEPYLFDLKEKFTMYKLENVLILKNKYAIRLYEIIRSYTTQKDIDEGNEKEVMLSLDELKEMLDVQAYNTWYDFDRYVIKKAIDEINECSDEIHITYEPYKVGKAVKKINFIIGTPRAADMLKAKMEKKRRRRS